MTVVEPPTGRANAATVAAPSGDSLGLCTQVVDSASGVSVSRSGNTCTVSFSAVAAQRTWTIPSGGLTNVSFTIKGAAGGSGSTTSVVNNFGAAFSGTIPLLAGGASVYVFVGSSGNTTYGVSAPGGSTGGSAGSNGGGSGGGATDVRVGGSTSTFRKIVAGGGGGNPGDPANRSPGIDAATSDSSPFSTAGSSGYVAVTSGGPPWTYACNNSGGGQVSAGGNGGYTQCRNSGGGGGGFAGGGGGGYANANLEFGTSRNDQGGWGGRGSSYIASDFAVGTTPSLWRGSAPNEGTGSNNTYSMYTNTGSGSFVVSFVLTASAVTTQPSAGQIDAVLGTQPAVTLTTGGTPTAGVTVTAALGTSPTPSGLQISPTLAGTTTATTDANGVAAFTDLKVTGPTGAYTLTFTASGFPTATSNSFTLTLGAASALKVSTQPTGGVSGGVVAGSPAVTVVDAGGNPVTSHPATSVTVSSSTGTIGGTTSVNTASGVAAFSAATLAGLVSANHTLTFAASGLTGVTSSTFNITAGAAAALSIQTQPVGGVAIGTALATQPVVRVVDAEGNVVSSAPTVTATIASGSSFASLGSDFVSASSGVATFSGLKVNGAGGSFTLTFSAPGLTPVTSSSFSVSLTSQAITFGALTAKTFGDAAFGISASTTSNLVIAYSSTTPAICSVTGNTTASAGATGAVVAVLGAGTCTIAADQAGDHAYAAATQQTQSFTVNPAAQAGLTLTNETSLTFGDTLTLKTSGGSGTGAVSYALVGGAGTAQCSLNATTGAMTFGAAGTCSVKATKAADTNYTVISTSTQVLTVARAAQATSITSAVPTTPLPGGTYAVTATSTSGLAPVIAVTTGAGTVCSLSGSTVTFLASGTCGVSATQAGNGNYLAADPADAQTIEVGALNQTITFSQPSDMEFGDPDLVLTPTASSGLPVTLASETTSVCTVTSKTVSIVSVGRCELKATQAGDARYAAASDEVRVLEIVAVAPTSPTVRSASASSGAITIGFTAPGFDGGATIVGYRLTATPTSGGSVVVDDSCATSPCVINGLSNGTEYTVTVAGLNSAGTGSASAPSPALTPVTNALAVQTLVATAGDTTLSVSWAAPADLGGGTFTRYEVRIREVGASWPGTATENVASSSTTSATLTGLTNGTEYEVQVVTITSANATSFDGNTAVVVAIPRRVPSSPRDLAAAQTTPSGVMVSWSVPVSDGGATITSYTVSFSGGANCGAVVIRSISKAGSCTATDLALGTTYTITVAAVNAAGSSSVVSTTHVTPTFPTSLPVPPTSPPCPSCVRDDTGGEIPGAPSSTPAGQKPGTITLTDGVMTVVLSGADGTDATMNAAGQLQFALGGKLSATVSNALPTTTIATWWDRTATATASADSAGAATVVITPPSGITVGTAGIRVASAADGTASIRVDVVSNGGTHRAFYFVVKVVPASSGSTGSSSGGSSAANADATTTTTTTPSSAGGTGGSAGGTTSSNDTVAQDTTKPRKPTKSGSFEPGSGESEILSSTGKVSKPKTVKTSKGITIEGGGVKVGISPSKGTNMSENASGQMVVSGPGKLNVSKSGLKPGSKVVVWLRPSMKRLAVANVKADGTIDVNLTLPDDLAAGDHLLQIDMVNADGEQVSMATGFSMSANRMPVTGSNAAGGRAAVFLLLIGLGLLLGRRRLRRSPSL